MRAIDDDREPVRRMLGEERCREWHHGDEPEEQEVEPDKRMVGALDLLGLRSVAEPEDAERDERQRISEERRPESGQVVEQRARRAARDVNLQDDEGHDDGEDAVAQRLDPARRSDPRDVPVCRRGVVHGVPFHSTNGARHSRGCSDNYLDSHRPLRQDSSRLQEGWSMCP